MIHRRNTGRTHPDWCHVERCQALALGEHRSTPLVVGLGPAGSIVATRVRTRGGRDHLELRVTAPLAGADEHGQAVTARRVLDTLTRALNGTRAQA